MSQTCLDERFSRSATVLIPGQKFLHFWFDPFCWRGFEMHLLLSFGARDYFDWAPAPRSRRNLAHSTAPGREQRSVPPENSLLREWRRVPLRRVEHHLHDAFHKAIRRPGACLFEPHAPRERGSDTVRAEFFA